MVIRQRHRLPHATPHSMAPAYVAAAHAVYEESRGRTDPIKACKASYKQPSISHNETLTQAPNPEPQSPLFLSRQKISTNRRDSTKRVMTLDTDTNYQTERPT